MCLESSAWGSDLCVPIWKASVTPCNRLLFRLVLSEPGTAANESGFLPTLTVSGNSNAKGAGPKSGEGLSTKLNAFLPALTAADAKGGIYKKPEGGPSLRTFAGSIGNGPLNPRWCEWFMGYPLGWTDLTIEKAKRL